MTIDDLPDLNPPPYGDIVDASRPILSFSWRFEGAHRVAVHSHERAHIIQPENGALWVITPEGTWLVPAGLAVWIAPRVHHQVYSRGTVSARMLFVDPAYADPLPHRCGTVRMSPLLEELLAKAVEYGNDYAPDGPMARLAAVALDELSSIELATLLLPVGRDVRLAEVMQRLIDDPACPAEVDELAESAGISPRTLARLFRNETGMSLSEWRTRLRLVESIERLAHGASVTEVAFDLGYSSTSSFVYMFRNNLGVTPGDYWSRAQAN